ncbi:Werner Syndrome-like exonuclease [Morella rubra]|uniref:Werner Syndrome-like exonuclease n=1 Tax=Morella rubra TaxID=262757 RepID=A0A6A1WBZ0_9ROSI|nr:Werner Syndrome-like exonuclease [Morella rubra]
MASISIFDHQLPDNTYNLYVVSLDSDDVLTLVTHSPSMVDSWISDIYRIHSRRLHRLVVGLDVEWRPSFNRHVQNPVATLQLCVGRRCLIFQIVRAPYFPDSLIEFLGDGSFTFVGVGIESDVEKLLDDYELEVANVVDLRDLVEEEWGIRELRNAGLKQLAWEVLGKDIQKPRRVTLSRWDNERLSHAQVQYACLDAFLSFEIGRFLNASG